MSFQIITLALDITAAVLVLMYIVELMISGYSSFIKGKGKTITIVRSSKRSYELVPNTALSRQSYL